MGGKGWEIERACVGGLDPLAIGQPGDYGMFGGCYVERWGISCEEVTGGARVEDGPTFNGRGVGADGFKEGCGDKGEWMLWVLLHKWRQRHSCRQGTNEEVVLK